ncbi:MAG: DUF3429 domain-containing protein [Pseudomonadota bacterium]
MKDVRLQKSLHDKPAASIPAAAFWLGLGGLIPFVALPIAVATEAVLVLPTWMQPHITVPALTLYAAIILSFMGGAQWGVAMRSVNDGGPVQDWRRYGVSVLPAILAWFALAMPTRSALIVISTGFVLLLMYDLWTVRKGEVPHWYERLRLGLTTVVVMSLTVTIVALS